MKSLRLDRCAAQLHPPRNPRLYLFAQRCPFSTHDTTRSPPRDLHRSRHHQADTPWRQQRRYISRTARVEAAEAAHEDGESDVSNFNDLSDNLGAVPPNFPLHHTVSRSAKLAALHARLSLPAKFSLQALARCLIDPSVDPRPGYSNASLAILGQQLLAYHTSEHLICHYPRLPMAILFAAQYAYVGPATLAAIRSEWGVEVAAAPGVEVDPGLLQLKRVTPGNTMAEDGMRRLKDVPPSARVGTSRTKEQWFYRRGLSSRMVYDDEFGDLQSGLPTPELAAPFPGAPTTRPIENTEEENVSNVEQDLPTLDWQSTPADHLGTEPVTVEAASAGFVRALVGALYLHSGFQAVKDFHKAHILSRHLELHKLFNFKFPTRDLSRLCAREGFEPPVARLISETGRLSRSPVFLVGVFSGNDKLGEAAGSSLDEGRVRASASALKAWYLYSPPVNQIVVPSAVESRESQTTWIPQIVDPGEIVT